jgi:hypothetical protein
MKFLLILIPILAWAIPLAVIALLPTPESRLRNKLVLQLATLPLPIGRKVNRNYLRRELELLSFEQLQTIEKFLVARKSGNTRLKAILKLNVKNMIPMRRKFWKVFRMVLV